MSAPNTTGTQDSDFQPNGRPQSTLARDFSAALDDLFKLNGIGALEESVEQKKDTLQTQKYQLDDLDARLRETDERLKRLEAKHHRQLQASSTPPRQPVSSTLPTDYDGEDSGDSDVHAQSSPARDPSR
ncbi:hypothetical protein ABEF95_001461 [Exophiala dermatitidis]